MAATMQPDASSKEHDRRNGIRTALYIAILGCAIAFGVYAGIYSGTSEPRSNPAWYAAGALLALGLTFVLSAAACVNRRRTPVDATQPVYGLSKDDWEVLDESVRYDIAASYALDCAEARRDVAHAREHQEGRTARAAHETRAQS